MRFTRLYTSFSGIARRRNPSSFSTYYSPQTNRGATTTSWSFVHKYGGFYAHRRSDWHLRRVREVGEAIGFYGIRGENPPHSCARLRTPPRLARRNLHSRGEGKATPKEVVMPDWYYAMQACIIIVLASIGMWALSFPP